MKKQFKVYGMMCTACASHVEHAVLALPFVSSASVSLLTSSLSVEFEGDEEEIFAAVKKAGYRACAIAEGEIAAISTEKNAYMARSALSDLCRTAVLF